MQLRSAAAGGPVPWRSGIELLAFDLVVCCAGVCAERLIGLNIEHPLLFATLMAGVLTIYELNGRDSERTAPRHRVVAVLVGGAIVFVLANLLESVNGGSDLHRLGPSILGAAMGVYAFIAVTHLPGQNRQSALPSPRAHMDSPSMPSTDSDHE